MPIICIFAIAIGSILFSTPTADASIMFSKSSCNKSDLNKIKKNKICLKNGKNYTWTIKKKPIQAPVTIAKPTPTPFQVGITYTPPSSPGLQVDVCKINEQSNARGSTGAGFPEWNSLTPKTGTVKWALVPIDFTDIPGEVDFRSRVNNQMLLLSEWFETVSEGKFKVEWVVADKWTTLSGKSTDYEVEQSQNLDRSPNGLKIFQESIARSDETFDYTGVQVVNFILPLKQKNIKETVQGFPWDSAVKNYTTNEGKISALTMPGVFFNVDGKGYWEYWAHEFGHSIGLPHIGTSRGVFGPFHSLDIMGDQSGPTKELSGWLRFLARWMPDEKIYCQEQNNIKETEIILAPLSSLEQGIKMSIIKLSESKALIIESRRTTKFSYSASWLNGVLVYVYDATLGHNEEFLIPAKKTGSSLLYQGDKITIEGITVEVLLSKNLDKIKITR
jgi:M6 family metalloprotease-like protein